MEEGDGVTREPRQPVRGSDLEVSSESMSDFTDRLHDLLGTLAERHPPSRLTALGLGSCSFGAAFPAADALASRYEAVRTRLQGFLRIQLEAVEALGIATTLTRRGYEAVEDAQLQRLRQIMSGWETVYGAVTEENRTED